jgi:hypothetical protein
MEQEMQSYWLLEQVVTFIVSTGLETVKNGFNHEPRDLYVIIIRLKTL